MNFGRHLEYVNCYDQMDSSIEFLIKNYLLATLKIAKFAKMRCPEGKVCDFGDDIGKFLEIPYVNGKNCKLQISQLLFILPR